MITLDPGMAFGTGTHHTTRLCAELLEKVVNPGDSILDMGTGSGCIAISLDLLLPQATVRAWDVSDDALEIARGNNRRLGGAVTFEKQDILSYVPSGVSYDVIVSNPPYVTESEKEDMDANVLDWEPSLALFVPNNDPLRFYRRIAMLGRELLVAGGKLYFEINRAYATETVELLNGLGYDQICVIKDLFGNNRMVTAIR